MVFFRLKKQVKVKKAEKQKSSRLTNSSALLGPSLDKFEKIRIKVGLVLVAICDKTEYTN